ncbi:alpha/beta hydrolase [Roseomonas sp. CAU 1739]
MLETADGISIHYVIDDFTDPWTSVPTVVFIHGLSESGQAFGPFVPALSRHMKVVRMDLRGYGLSPAMPADHSWKFDGLVEDVAALIRSLAVPKVHLVGGKIGGTISLAVAARHPDLIDRLAVLGAPASLKEMASVTPGWRQQIAREGVVSWVRATNGGRMGSKMTPDQLEWWARMMGRTAPSTLEGFLQMVPSVDVRDEVHRISAPTLVVTTTGSGLGSVETVRAWQVKIPNSRLEVVESDSYHVAASDADEVAKLVRDFLLRPV